MSAYVLPTKFRILYIPDLGLPSLNMDTESFVEVDVKVMLFGKNRGRRDRCSRYLKGKVWRVTVDRTIIVAYSCSPLCRTCSANHGQRTPFHLPGRKTKVGDLQDLQCFH